jgi:MFS family permease
VAQLWAIATDIFSLEQGKRLFPLLGAGASAGAVAGAWIAGQLIKPLGSYKIMLIAVAALCICAAMARLAARWSEFTSMDPAIRTDVSVIVVSWLSLRIAGRALDGQCRGVGTA